MTDPFPELSPSDLFADVRRVGVIRREGRQRERVRRDVVNTIGEYEASYPPFLWQPPPVLATLDPTSGDLGAATTLTVTGTGFVLSSVVYAGDVALPTTYVSDTELTAVYTPTAPGDVAITVRNGPRTSNAATFTVGVPLPASLDPASGNVNEAQTLTVTGTGFVASSVVYAGDEALPTTYVSGTELTATWTPTVGGDVAVTVHTGSYVSDPVSFTVLVPFRPDQVPGLYGWFDSADPSTFVYSSDAEISEWINKGSGVNFFQPVIGIQPTRSTDETGQNGHAKINFDSGVGDCLENQEFMWPAVPGQASNRPYTEYLCYHPYGASYGQSHSSPYIDRNHLAPDTVTWRYLVGGGSVSWPVGVAPIDHQPQIFTFVVNTNAAAGSLKAYRDGVQVGSGTNSGWSIDNGLRIGGRLDGQEIWRSFFYSYFEFLIFEGVHDEATQRQIEKYLQEKWGTAALPTYPEDLDPTTIAGLDGWLDAADDTTFTYSSTASDGGEISEWADKSGKAHHATRSDIATQPTRSGGLVYFAPTPDTLAGPASDWNMDTETINIFFVAMFGDPNAAYQYAYANPTGTICLKGFQPYYSHVTSTSWTHTTALTDTNVFHRDEMRVQPTGLFTMWRDSVQVVNGGPMNPWTPVPAPYTVRLGGAGWWHLRELLVYASPTGLPDSDITRIRDYLAAKWNLP